MLWQRCHVFLTSGVCFPLCFTLIFCSASAFSRLEPCNCHHIAQVCCSSKTPHLEIYRILWKCACIFLLQSCVYLVLSVWKSMSCFPASMPVQKATYKHTLILSSFHIKVTPSHIFFCLIQGRTRCPSSWWSPDFFEVKIEVRMKSHGPGGRSWVIKPL